MSNSAANCSNMPTNCSSCFEKVYCLKYVDHPTCNSMPDTEASYCTNTCARYLSCDEAKAQFVTTPPSSNS